MTKAPIPAGLPEFNGDKYKKHDTANSIVLQALPVPYELLGRAQFVTWKLIYKPEKEKPDKVLCNLKTHKFGSVTDPSTWGTYEEACAAFKSGNKDGIGFVFTDSDPWCFFDLDDCIDENERIHPDAKAVMESLPNAAWEISQSCKGFHGIIRVDDKAALASRRKKFRTSSGIKCEFYTQGRFVAFGKCNWSRLDLPMVQADFIKIFVPENQQVTSRDATAWEQPAPEVSQDAGIIKKLLEKDKKDSRVIFGGEIGENEQLWNGDVALGTIYPDAKRPFDNSAAEMALANKLAYLCTGNAAQIERIMTVGPLCKRKKWQNRPDYRRRTIEKSVASYHASYRNARREEDRNIGDDCGFKTLPEILTLSTALERFIYVQSGSILIDRITKTSLPHADMQRAYAASKHMSNDGKEIPVIKVWLAHPNRLSVDVATWCPGEPEFCSAPERSAAGSRAYNLWAGLQILPAPDDWRERAQPFLDHVTYLVPQHDERQFFLCWLAHIFQRPNELPHHHFLMFTSQTGTGRGTLASIITRALRGYVAANLNVNALFGGFNGRVSQKLLATIDEIREGISTDRYTKSEALKSCLTEETRAINPKYGLQSVERNVCRFLMSNNHDDALPFDNAYRRIVVIQNPSSRRSQEDYAQLHKLVEQQEFIASVQQFLMTLDISHYNPHAPAPMNAAKQAALRSLESEIDRAAREFKETWPGDFATVSDLREFSGEERISSAALRYAIERSGMRTGHKLKMHGKTETLLIVSQDYAADQVTSAMNDKIVKQILEARSIVSVTVVPVVPQLVN